MAIRREENMWPLVVGSCIHVKQGKEAPFGGKLNEQGNCILRSRLVIEHMVLRNE